MDGANFITENLVQNDTDGLRNDPQQHHKDLDDWNRFAANVCRPRQLRSRVNRVHDCLHRACLEHEACGIISPNMTIKIVDDKKPTSPDGS